MSFAQWEAIRTEIELVIIDAHTHRYPLEVIEDVITFGRHCNELHWLDLVDPSNSKSLQGWSKRDQMLMDMDAASLDKAVLLGWYWENPETCRLQNNWHAEWINEDPDRFFAFATIHPAMKNSIEELYKRKEQGFVGIGECHPWVQSSSLRNSSWQEILGFAEEHAWPITFHVTEPVGHDYPGRTPTPFEEFLWLAREYPDLKIILAHAGGLFPFYELNPKIRPVLKNVYYDLAACPLLYDSSLYRKLIETVGHEKILWGTDYPLRVFPKAQKIPDFSSSQESILNSASLSNLEKEAIFGNNFLSLLPC